MRFTYDYPRPCVTTDCLIFRKMELGWSLLLIERGNEPFKGCWALPGGFLEMEEDLDACAARELQEETVAGIIAEDSLDLRVNGLCCETVHALQYVLSPAAGTVSWPTVTVSFRPRRCCTFSVHVSSTLAVTRCPQVWTCSCRKSCARTSTRT